MSKMQIIIIYSLHLCNMQIVIVLEDNAKIPLRNVTDQNFALASNWKGEKLDYRFG